MFSLSSLFRMGAVFRTSNCGRINGFALTNAVKIHTSALQKQEQHDVEEDFASDLEPKRSYLSQVTLIGDVVSKPKPLYRDGNVFGYKLRILSKKRFKTAEGYRVHNHYHNAVCNNRRFFPLLEESLDVDDQIFVRGQLVNVELTNLEENSYMTLIRANSVHLFKN